MNLAAVRRELAAGRTLEQLTQSVMSAIVTAESGPDRLNAFISFNYEQALTAAGDVATRIASGALQPFAGVPVAIKDNFCTFDHATTCASRMLANFRAPYDATAVRRLRAAGAIIAGKANLDEFAMGSSTESSVFGRTRNPHDPKRVTGGSSGGCAAAVAAGLVPVALGSDTAGSVRQPAAFCGVVGLKPTYGRISRYGLIAYASSLDTVGILASCVRDASEVLDLIAGPDEYDATCARRPHVPATFANDLAGRVIGVPREYFPPNLHKGVRARCDYAIEKLRAAGAEIREVKLPTTRFAIPAYYALSTAEACSNLARYDGVRYGARARAADSLLALYERTRSIGFGAEVQRRILLGMHVLSENGRTSLQRAARAVAALKYELNETFASGVDLLFTPTAPTPAFVAGEKTDPYELYLSDMFTVAANLTCAPAISIPIGHADGMPVGGQLLAPPWQEARLLDAAAALEALLA